MTCLVFFTSSNLTFSQNYPPALLIPHMVGYSEKDCVDWHIVSAYYTHNYM